MSKPKHPTFRSIRSGQTVYCVGVESSRSHKVYVVAPLRIGKESDMRKWGTTTQVTREQFRQMRTLAPGWLLRYFFYSPRKAESFRKQLTLESRR